MKKTMCWSCFFASSQTVVSYFSQLQKSISKSSQWKIKRKLADKLTMKTPVAFGETSGKRKLSQSVQNFEHRLYQISCIIFFIFFIFYISEKSEFGLKERKKNIKKNLKSDPEKTPTPTPTRPRTRPRPRPRSRSRPRSRPRVLLTPKRKRAFILNT